MNKWLKGGPYLRHITDEINLFVNPDVWTTLHNRVPPQGHDCRMGGDSSFARGDMTLIEKTEEPTGLRDFGMKVAYLLPAEQLWFVRELEHILVSLRFSSVQ